MVRVTESHSFGSFGSKTTQLVPPRIDDSTKLNSRRTFR